MTNGSEAEASGRKKKLIAAAVVAGVAVIGVALTVRWFKRGGVRHAVTGIAEEGAVALADLLVDEIFPAA